MRRGGRRRPQTSNAATQLATFPQGHKEGGRFPERGWNRLRWVDQLARAKVGFDGAPRDVLDVEHAGSGRKCHDWVSDTKRSLVAEDLRGEAGCAGRAQQDRERAQAALARFLDQLRIHAFDPLPLAIAQRIDHETIENGAFRTKAIWRIRRQSMRKVARRQQDGRPTKQALMEPGSEREEAGERPAADA